MFAFPTEILLHIFTTACTDDGNTGRSLSRVSRRFHAASKEVKLQSVAVRGASQLRAFAKVLLGTPERFRRVRHLFVVNIQDSSCNTVNVSTFHEISRHFWDHEHDASYAFLQILVLVAPTLWTLSFVSNVPRTHLLIPVSLPQVTSITLYGRIRVSERPTEDLPSFPSLQHLSLLSFTETPPAMLEDISRHAPSLTHLTLVPENPSRHLPSTLSLLAPPRSPTTLLPSLEKISVLLSKTWENNMWTNLTRNVMLRDLNTVVAADSRITVIEGVDVQPYRNAEYLWLQDSS